MARGHRTKTRPLTKVKPKGRQGKEQLVDRIREAFEQYKSVYVLDVGLSRTTHLKAVREHFSSTGRLFFGKRKVMANALGLTRASSVRKNAFRLVPYLSGSAGLFFTSEPPRVVGQYIASFTRTDFATAGTVAPVAFDVPTGPLSTEMFSGVEMTNNLTRLGLPVRMQDGAIHVLEDVRIVAPGEELTPQQCRVLRLFGVEMGAFKVAVSAYWSDGAVYAAQRR
eukprot:TRINITY_DN2419_c0_g1_i1.p2 TRINITY_DN2419_c0_g1~~TRINITY_DN2419_c0_g1_i1.p2  ORF type:complete len:224 (-),score=34.97 TRINITY_DN2419_c0_g1_i1:72-743(-)